MRKKNNNKIIAFSILVFLIIVFLVWYAFSNKRSENFNNIKIDSSKYLVYTSNELDSGSYKQYIPFVNIEGEIGELINNNINEYINSFTNDDTCITYEYDLSGNVLSLLLKVEDHSIADKATLLYFRSYNINLKHKEILSNETIFSYFNISNSMILNSYNSKLEEYYNGLVSNNMINSNECNFNCFYKNGEFTNSLDDAEYYIKEGKLFVYKPYVYYSLSDDDEIMYGFQVSE